MDYLGFVKQFGWDRLAGLAVRVAAAIVEAVLRLVKRRRPRPVPCPDGVRVTVLSISTETIAVTRLGGEEDDSGQDEES